MDLVRCIGSGIPTGEVENEIGSVSVIYANEDGSKETSPQKDSKSQNSNAEETVLGASLENVSIEKKIDSKRESYFANYALTECNSPEDMKSLYCNANPGYMKSLYWSDNPEDRKYLYCNDNPKDMESLYCNAEELPAGTKPRKVKVRKEAIEREPVEDLYLTEDESEETSLKKDAKSQDPEVWASGALLKKKASTEKVATEIKASMELFLTKYGSKEITLQKDTKSEEPSPEVSASGASPKKQASTGKVATEIEASMELFLTKYGSKETTLQKDTKSEDPSPEVSASGASPKKKASTGKVATEIEAAIELYLTKYGSKKTSLQKDQKSQAFTGLRLTHNIDHIISTGILPMSQPVTSASDPPPEEKVLTVKVATAIESAIHLYLAKYESKETTLQKDAKSQDSNAEGSASESSAEKK